MHMIYALTYANLVSAVLLIHKIQNTRSDPTSKDVRKKVGRYDFLLNAI